MLSYVAIVDLAIRRAFEQLELFVRQGASMAKYQYVDVVTPAAAATDFVVPHSLNTTNVHYEIVKSNVAGVVYQDTSSTATAWTPTTIVLRANPGGLIATLRLSVPPE